MIEKLKYDYKMTMPDADRYLGNYFKESVPELFPAKKDVSCDAAVDVKLMSSYNTNGWDTVTICYVSDLNTAIENQKTYPTKMDCKLVEDNKTYRLQAEFEPWAITVGGSGGNINLRIGFKSGTLYTGEDTYPITSAEAVIQVKLNFRPQPEKVAEPGDYMLKLKDEKDSGGLNPISVLQFESNLPPLAVAPAAQALLSAWLNLEETLKSIDILFSTIQLNAGDSDEYKWLVPTYSSYAYADVDGDLTKSKFGLLCMVMDRVAPDQNQIPAVTFQEGSNCAFLINREVYAQYQLLPSLPEAFEDASADDFKLDGTRIKASGLSLPAVTYGAIDYHPELTSLTLEVGEKEIVCQIDFKTEISPGIVASTFIETHHGVTLGKNDAGEAIMTYYESSPEIVRNSNEIAAWIYVTEALVDLIMLVVTAVGAKICETIIKRIIIVVIVALIAAVISVVIHAIIEKVIAEGVTAGIPGLAPMLQASVKYVKWPFLEEKNSADFEVKSIQLNGELYFEGVIS